jgi:TonB family protein
VRDAGAEALTAAIGHELVHVWRRDYLLNLIYEIILLPLSFHPAAALMRRRITQTRELRCDELVAELLLHPEVYARSLVQLAGSAMPFARRARTVTVGIADADILEVRIMSLLKRTNLHTGRRRLLLIAAALLLVIPCAAAGVFAFHLNIGSANAQEPSTQEKREMEGRARMEQQMKARAEEDQELRERIAKETNQEVKAKLEALLERRLEERAKSEYKIEFGQNDKTEFRAFLVNGEGATREREQESKRQAQLASLARISMDRAIQIAVSQTPGKVFECSLVGEHWEGAGELAKPGLVLYHVVILTGDDAQPTRAHVLVNAFDGTIFRAEKEERRRVNVEGEQRLKVELEPLMTSSGERRAINGGVLNGKATEMPPPEYPAIARQAHASGAVTVEIMIDEGGNVIAAKAVSGHPLLQAAAVNAARQAIFTPTRLSGEPVRVNGVLVYNFVAQ